MCLLMTIISAVIFAALFYFKRTKALSFSTAMFSAASLMWCVDGIASILEGESFFDISMEDTILGLIIVASGLLVYTILSIREKHGI